MPHLKVHDFHVGLEKRKLVGDVLHLARELEVVFFLQGMHRGSISWVVALNLRTVLQRLVRVYYVNLLLNFWWVSCVWPVHCES